MSELTARVVQLTFDARPTAVVIVRRETLSLAWQWVVRKMSGRPDAPGSFCLFDHKLWLISGRSNPLCLESVCLYAWSNLYLTSQFGNQKTILEMVNSQRYLDIQTGAGSLDPDIRSVIQSPKRFRSALAEHLAFWTRLATEAQRPSAGVFGCSLPNVQPEDKGPDGLFMKVGSSNRVELHSVKNSINSPSAHVSSPSFRNKGVAHRGKQLDDFWLKARKNLGLVRLERMLGQLLSSLDADALDTIRLALIAECGYNAVVVADEGYARSDLFQGFERVAADPLRRVATYIGAESWQVFADAVRRVTKKILVRCGVW